MPTQKPMAKTTTGPGSAPAAKATNDRPSATALEMAAICPAARALDVLGERWTLLVLREVFYGVRRFDEMLDRLGCARNILSDRLAKLVGYGILTREPYRDEGQRARYEYRLTDAGREVLPILVALMQWGDRWLPKAPETPHPVELVSRASGLPIRAELRDSAGAGPLAPREIQPRFNPAVLHLAPPRLRPVPEATSSG